MPKRQLWQSSRLLMIAMTIALLSILTQLADAQSSRPSGVGFTFITPNMGNHEGGGLCAKAGWSNPLLLKPSLRYFKLKDDPLFTGNYGTGFVDWLRGGQQAIISRLSRFKPGSCTHPDPCCVPFESTILDELVVDLKTGAIVSRPTIKFRESKGNDAKCSNGNGLYCYSVLQPVYANGRNQLIGFLLVTHHDFNTPRTETWLIKPDGTPDHEASGDPSGGHGCQKSPNDQYLACGRTGQDWYTKGFLVIKPDGTSADVIWAAHPHMPIDVAVWSSDSAGFVFYACDGSCTDRGYIAYYDVEKKNITPLANYYSPAFFCSSGRCRDTYASGSDLPAASPVAGWFYYSALFPPLPGDNKLRRVLGSVSRSDPNVFHALTSKENTEPGHPTVSSDNKRVAFIANAPDGTKRAALYIVDVRMKIVRPLGKLPPNRPELSAYAPNYQDRR